MSALLGYWNFDGAPANASTLAGMSRASGYAAPDGEQRHLTANFASTVRTLNVTAEDSECRQPFVARSGVVCGFDGALHNREELAREFSWTSDQADRKADVEYVAEAYADWGEDFAAHLDGEFAILIFDAAAHRLLLARDLLGVRPLYYAECEATFAFATEIKCIASHPEFRAKPDANILADVVMAGDAGLHPETCFAGVFRVLPGEVVLRTPERRRTKIFATLGASCNLRRAGFEECAVAVRQALQNSVRRRTRTQYPIGMAVSGGFDSSSLYCLAQQLQAGSGSAAPITGMSLTYVGCAAADESEYLAPLERAFRREIVRLPVQPGFMRLARHTVEAGEAPIVRLHGDSEYAKWEACGRLGARTLVEGWFGDQITYSIGYWLDLLLRGKVVETWRGMKGFAGSFGNGSAAHWALPLAQIARAMLAPAGIRPALRRMRQLWNPLHQPSWYSAQFCERATERALRQNSELLLGGSYHSQYLRSMATTAYYRINLEVLGKISGSLGLQTTYPFFDRDLIQLVMSIPGETLNFRHQPRALFREALRGIVPDEVRLRRGKANFSSFLVSSVDQDLAAIEALLKNESIAADLGYVRMDNLRAEVALLRERWCRGDTATLPRLGGLLGLELWLRTFIAGEKSRLPAPTEAATA